MVGGSVILELCINFMAEWHLSNKGTNDMEQRTN